MPKLIFFISFLLILNGQCVFAQDFIPGLESNKDSNSELVLTSLINRIKILQQNPNTDAILLSRYYNKVGEIYYTRSDIGEAYNYWMRSFKLIKSSCGERSIYMAENYSLFARFYNFKINLDSAYYFSRKSIEICNKKKDSLKYIPVNKIYREYAYALKEKKEKENYLNSRAEARIYFDSALYFNNKYFVENILFKAMIFQDIGNLYTDNSLHYKRDCHNHVKSSECLNLANSFYKKALAIRTQAFGNKNESIASIYFVRALGFDYCYGDDSIANILYNYQKALCSSTPGFDDESVFSLPDPKSNFLNPVQVLTILRFKIDILYRLYQKKKDSKYLLSCYNHSKVAVELWKKAFTELRTMEIHQALEIYDSSPFSSAIAYSNEYFQLTKDEGAKDNIFMWMDLNKYSVLLKNQLENKIISLQANNISVKEIQGKLGANEAIVEYYSEINHLTCAVITKNKFELFLQKNISNSDRQIDSLITNLKKHNSKGYCIASKCLYDSIFAPFTKNLPGEINHLIIIPHGKLSTIPFDALILNNASTYSRADFLIKHYNITYALSCNLEFCNNANNLLNNNLSLISPQYKTHSNLPFSKGVLEELKSSFNLSNFILTDTSKRNTILHIAAHACCDYQNSRNSFVLLSDNEKLFLNTISSAKLNYKLAVLNACETANGELELGEGIINFNRHLYLAGIHSAITTLWKVDDEATASIIKEFYSEVNNGIGTESSLYNAKLKYLSSARSIDDYDPYYWAGLIYTGNDLKFEERKSDILLYGFIGIGVILGLGLVPLFRKVFF